MKKKIQKLIKEIKQRPPQLPWFNVQLDRDKRGVAHGETDIRYEFKTDEVIIQRKVKANPKDL